MRPQPPSSSLIKDSRALRPAPARRGDCLAAHTLLAIARQRPGFDAELCRVVFEHLDTAAALHAALQQTLAQYRLSELQFGVLVVLFTLDPSPATPADLAIHTAVSRSAMTEALDHLERQGFVGRSRDERDRRIIQVQLTPDGRALAEPATHAFLATLAETTRFIDRTTRTSLLGGYALLQAGAGSA